MCSRWMWVGGMLYVILGGYDMIGGWMVNRAVDGYEYDLSDSAF